MRSKIDVQCNGSSALRFSPRFTTSPNSAVSVAQQRSMQLRWLATLWGPTQRYRTARKIKDTLLAANFYDIKTMRQQTYGFEGDSA